MARLSLLVAVALALVPGTALGAGLDQLPGASGCLTPGTVEDCTPLRGFIVGDFRPAIAADPAGRSVYAVTSTCEPVATDCNDTGGLAVLTRDAATGALTQPAGAAGCFTHDGRDGCAGAPLRNAASVAASPDGRHVYVGVAFGVVSFARTADGRLAFIDYLQDRVFGPGQALGAAHVTVSPDGRHVYAAAERGHAVVALRRDRTSGRLRVVQCWSGSLVAGCGSDRRLRFPTSVAVSPDGREVLAGGVVARYRREPVSGRLTRRRGGRAGATWVAFGPRGTSVYTAGTATNGGGRVRTIFRNARTGALRAPRGRAGCVDDGASRLCRVAAGLTRAVALAVAPGAGFVYAAAPAGDSVVALRRAANGLLAGLPGNAGCVAVAGKGGCRAGRALEGTTGVAPTRDGKHVYTVGRNGVAAFTAAAP